MTVASDPAFVPGKSGGGAKDTSRWNRKVQIAFGSAMVTLLIVGGISYRAMMLSYESAQWVRHTHEVLDTLKDMLVGMSSIESAIRGFALTGNEDYLISYRANLLNIAEAQTAIRTLTQDNPSQQVQIPELEKLAAQKIERSEVVIGLRRTGGMAAAENAFRNGIGRQLMNGFQATVGNMQNEERRLLALRDVDAARSFQEAKIILIVGTFLGLSIAAAAGWSMQRDLNMRRVADEHLAQMEGRYRGLLEAAPDAMVVVNAAGDIVLLNVQAEKQFGYSRDELLGQKVKNIIPEGFAERLVADGTRTKADALDQRIGTGIELSGRRKDGSRFPIEIMLSPLESPDSGILVTAAIRNISVRKAADEHLAQMEGRYRGLLEAAPDAMVVVDIAGAIVLLNVQAEKQFGYSRDELLGQKVKNIIPEGFAERLLADALRSTEDALAQKIGTGIELSGRRKNGSEFPIEIMLSPLQSADGLLVTAAIRDISVRKQADEHLLLKMDELNRSNEELGQFAYIASHDLQEPLRMVASYTQLLSRRYKGKLDADADDFIGYAVDGANRMQRLIQDLLTYSRVGTKGINLTDISSEKALQHALVNLQGAIGESAAVVTHDPLPDVMADEIQLTQLFQNLVGNGIKYHSIDSPRVHISVARQGAKKWLFSVKDNGLGIDRQYFERIFGMFQRLHKREEFAGTGIGLAICKKIVERHGGHISVESQPGQGSTFRFALTGSEGKS
jgi:PAS domain S-box-containing protein